MKPIKFKHANTTFAENQKEYQSLPALKIDGEKGVVISCWKLSFVEKIKILFTGKIWLSLMTFNKPLTPHLISVYRKEIYSHPDDEKNNIKNKKNEK